MISNAKNGQVDICIRNQMIVTSNESISPQDSSEKCYVRVHTDNNYEEDEYTAENEIVVVYMSLASARRAMSKHRSS
jgi:hypothetical protein